MKNKELIKEKLKMVAKLLLRVAIAFLTALAIYIIFDSSRLKEKMVDYLYINNREFYYFFDTYQGTFVLIFFSIAILIAIYSFISKYVNNEYKICQALDKVLDETNEEINLPSEVNKFSEKINKIKYDYTLSKSKEREAIQKKNDLIMYMAHDLKTPLTSVIGYLTLLNDEKHISKDLQDKYIKIALDKSNRLEELTNEFFEITRYNLQEIPIIKKKIDLSFLMDQLIDEFYPMFQEKGLKCIVNKPKHVEFNGDGDKLARAFGNLIRNAINYSYENTDIEIEIIQDEEKINITFKNKGDKIPEHKLEKIFDKFYRADESRTTSTGGTGLGLAIARDIVELHSGTISVKNEDEYIEFNIEFFKCENSNS